MINNNTNKMIATKATIIIAENINIDVKDILPFFDPFNPRVVWSSLPLSDQLFFTWPSFLRSPPTSSRRSYTNLLLCPSPFTCSGLRIFISSSSPPFSGFLDFVRQFSTSFRELRSTLGCWGGATVTPSSGGFYFGSEAFVDEDAIQPSVLTAEVIARCQTVLIRS